MFLSFKKSLQDKLDFLTQNSCALFTVGTPRVDLWSTYLESFPEGSNPIYRENTVHDCNCCQSFIKNYGDIVGIIGNKTVSIWDIEVEGPYQTVVNAMSALVHKNKISSVFYTPEIFGKDHNFDANRPDHEKYDHLYYKFKSTYVTSGYSAKMGAVNQLQAVIKRSFEEITPSTVSTVLELIADKILYRGEEHEVSLRQFQTLQEGYIRSKNKSNYCWKAAVQVGRKAAIRNTAIGTLLINLSELMELELAVKKYEAVVAPANYKRPKAIFTASMKKAAENKVTELGLMEALPRRYAKIEDISIQDVLWASGESKKVMINAFDTLSEAKVTSKFDNVQEMGIETFIEDVLPTAKTLELMVENSYENNFVSLIAPQNENAGSLLQWHNNFSWSYNGNFTDSIKESVKIRGGSVTGVLRCSLSWAEKDSSDNSDLDLHCILPDKGRIFFSQSHHIKSGGKLDVDITQPNQRGNQDIVENITFPSKNKMPKGEYTFLVRNFALRGTQKGFTAEIEFNGTTHTFVYDQPLRNKEDVNVATVKFDGTNFEVIQSLPSSKATKEIWGINTMTFVPVSTVMLSPNHWGSEHKGNKHFFFMLKDCINNGTVRGFYNEFLRGDLVVHKKVFEALGASMKVEHTNNQLSGVGFSSTMKNSVVLKINSKPIKINFTNESIKSIASKVSV